MSLDLPPIPPRADVRPSPETQHLPVVYGAERALEALDAVTLKQQAKAKAGPPYVSRLFFRGDFFSLFGDSNSPKARKFIEALQAALVQPPISLNASEILDIVVVPGSIVVLITTETPGASAYIDTNVENKHVSFDFEDTSWTANVSNPDGGGDGSPASSTSLRTVISSTLVALVVIAVAAGVVIKRHQLTPMVCPLALSVTFGACHHCPLLLHLHPLCRLATSTPLSTSCLVPI